MDEQHNQLVAYVLDNPEEAAAWITELRAALQAYVDEAKSHSSQGKPDSPFRLRLVAAEKALAPRQ
jgi:plasmid stabilization system protein ParE